MSNKHICTRYNKLHTEIERYICTLENIPGRYCTLSQMRCLSKYGIYDTCPRTCLFLRIFKRGVDTDHYHDTMYYAMYTIRFLSAHFRNG